MAFLLQPSVMVVLTTLLVLAVIFWPGYGLFWQLRRTRQRNRRILIEDALKHVYHFRQQELQATLESLAGVLKLRRSQVLGLMHEMEEIGLIQYGAPGLRLTPKGEALALQIVRAHRLWETYLAHETGFDELDWHAQAERQEHQLSPARIEALSTRLGHPVYDPHGDPIPNAKGEHVDHPGQPLSSVENDQLLQIVHLEDEPAVVYAQLVAEGLHPGMKIQLIERSERRIRFVADGEEHLLAPLLAANISVEPLPEKSEEGSKTVATLDQLAPGEKARVIEVAKSCRGLERRRLMDLGILPGARIEVGMESPLGDPTAYRVRDTLIALRQGQAKQIRIERSGEKPEDQPATAVAANASRSA